MKKMKTLLALALMLMGTTALRAETVTADFNSGLPEGWSIVGSITNDDTRARSGKGLWTYAKSSTDNYVITSPVEGTFEFYARAYNKSTASYVYVYEYTGSGLGEKLSETNLYTSSTPSWSKYSVTLTRGTQLAIVLNYAAIDDVTYTPYTVTDGPALTVKDEGQTITSPYAYNFGLAAAGDTKTFTLTNPGTETLNATITATGGYKATPASVAIASGESKDLTITMPASSADGVVTIKGNGIDNFVINVSGTVRDPNKVFVDFADGTLPDGWTAENKSTYDAYQWTFSEGYASHSGTSASYGGTLTSPQLTFTAGEKLIFSTARYGNSAWYSPSISVKTSADGTNWTTLATYTDDTYGTWNTRTVTIPSADVKYVQFEGWYIHLTNIYGGELPKVANMKAEVADHAFGMVSADASQEFTIKNIGGAKLTGLKAQSSDNSFTVAVPSTIDAASSTQLTVTLKATTPGYHEATITVSATGQTNATFKVSGYVIDNDAILVTFDDNQLPEGWENTGWEFSDGYATGRYTSSTSSRNSEMVSPAITVAAGETMAFEAMGTSSYGEFKVYTSTDNGTTWTLAKDFSSQLSTSQYSVLILNGISAGNYKLKLEGYAVRVNTINGFHLNANAPALTVNYGSTAVAGTYTDDFGKVKSAVKHTYTVKNTGTGTLKANISSSDNKQFTVSPANVTLAAGEEANVDITVVMEPYGEKSATITFHPTTGASTDVTVNATAITSDPNIWDEDFENGIPAIWNNNGWEIRTRYSGSNTTQQAFSGTSDSNTLTTPRLKATKGQVLTFEVQEAEESYPLTVEWSKDGQTWNSGDRMTITSEGTHSFVAPEAGTYYLRFSGKYIYIDNFLGLKLDLPDHSMVIASDNIPAEGNQFVEYTATITVREQVSKDEEATAKLYVDGKEVATAQQTIAAGGQGTFTLTYTPEEAKENVAAYIEVTYAGGTLKTDPQTITIHPAFTLDEATASEITTGTKPVAILKYTVRKGWNTICLPFTVTDLSIFGEGAKAYQLRNYVSGVMHFDAASTIYYGTPYVLYVETPATQTEFRLNNVAVNSTEGESATNNGVTFQGTYQPVAAPGMQGKYGLVPTTAEIKKGGDKASLKGFHAYFTLDGSVSANDLTLTFHDNGQQTSIQTATLDEESQQDTYDLSGRKMENKTLQKGIYVRNGKKHVVK